MKWVLSLGKHFSNISVIQSDILITFSFIGIPMLVLYVIGFPVMHFTVLYINRNRLHDPVVIRYLLLLYQGVKHDRYYWELVNTTRKFLLLVLHIFISDDLKVLKALFGALILFISSLWQARLRPFKIGVVTDLGKFIIAYFLQNTEKCYRVFSLSMEDLFLFKMILNYKSLLLSCS